MRDAYEVWALTEPDLDVQLDVLSWLHSLQDGPPDAAIYDPFRETFFAQAGDTDVWAEFVVLPYLADPAIVIHALR